MIPIFETLMRRALGEPLQPLSLALADIDAYWAIEATYATRYRKALDNIDWQAHAEEFQRLQAVSVSINPDADQPDNRRYDMNGAAAVFTMSGPMTKKPQSWGGGNSTIVMRNMLRQAKRDDAVKGGFLVVDTPGGQISGCDDLAIDIADFAAAKPLVVYAEDCCCSAGYYAVSPATEIYSNANCMLVNMGVVTHVDDSSKMLSMLGITRHLIATGKFKGIGTPGVKVTDAAIAEFMRIASEFCTLFVASVAAGRNMTVAKTTKIADGRVYIGQDAVGFGFIDGVCTIDAAFERLQVLMDDPGAAVIRALPDEGDDDDPADEDETPPDDDEPETDARLQQPTPRTISIPTPTAPAKPGAVSTSPQPEEGGKDNHIMVDVKAIAVRAARRFGLLQIATRVSASAATATDNDEIITEAMEGIKAEVDARVEGHPLMLACAAHGIKSVSDIESLIAKGKVADQYRADLLAKATLLATSAYADDGPTIAASYAAMGIEDLKKAIKANQKIADQFAGRDTATGKSGGRKTQANPVAKTGTETDDDDEVSAEVDTKSIYEARSKSDYGH